MCIYDVQGREAEWTLDAENVAGEYLQQQHWADIAYQELWSLACCRSARMSTPGKAAAIRPVARSRSTGCAIPECARRAGQQRRRQDAEQRSRMYIFSTASATIASWRIPPTEKRRRRWAFSRNSATRRARRRRHGPDRLQAPSRCPHVRLVRRTTPGGRFRSLATVPERTRLRRLQRGWGTVRFFPRLRDLGQGRQRVQRRHVASPSGELPPTEARNVFIDGVDSPPEVWNESVGTSGNGGLGAGGHRHSRGAACHATRRRRTSSPWSSSTIRHSTTTSSRHRPTRSASSTPACSSAGSGRSSRSRRMRRVAAARPAAVLCAVTTAIPLVGLDSHFYSASPAECARDAFELQRRVAVRGQRSLPDAAARRRHRRLPGGLGTRVSAMEPARRLQPPLRDDHCAARPDGGQGLRR